jgi:hypothetical protein
MINIKRWNSKMAAFYLLGDLPEPGLKFMAS